jgi:hypothetical protein
LEPSVSEQVPLKTANCGAFCKICSAISRVVEQVYSGGENEKQIQSISLLCNRRGAYRFPGLVRREKRTCPAAAGGACGFVQ